MKPTKEQIRWAADRCILEDLGIDELAQLKADAEAMKAMHTDADMDEVETKQYEIWLSSVAGIYKAITGKLLSAGDGETLAEAIGSTMQNFRSGIAAALCLDEDTLKLRPSNCPAAEPLLVDPPHQVGGGA